MCSMWNNLTSIVLVVFLKTLLFIYFTSCPHTSWFSLLCLFYFLHSLYLEFYLWYFPLLLLFLLTFPSVLSLIHYLSPCSACVLGSFMSVIAVVYMINIHLMEKSAHTATCKKVRNWNVDGSTHFSVVSLKIKSELAIFHLHKKCTSEGLQRELGTTVFTL